MNVISHVLPDALIASPLVSGGALSGQTMSLDAIVSSPMVFQDSMAASVAIASASDGTFNTTYVVEAIFETKSEGGQANIFVRNDGALIAVTDEGEQVQIGRGG